MERTKKSTGKPLTRKDLDDTLNELQKYSRKNEYTMLFGKKGLEMFDAAMRKETWKERLLKTLKNL